MPHAPSVIIQLILLVFAFVCFVFAALNQPNPPRWNLVAGGLAFWVASTFAASFQ